jgi:O-antigen/teichoic acid export membrane protein
LATTSVTQIANFGLSGSVIKYVAKYVAHRDDEKVSSVIQTAAISVAGFGSCILLIGYPIAKLVLGLVIENEFISLSLSILPYTFLALWILIITSIFQAGLDGFQRIDLRSIVLSGSAVLNLILCFMIVPKYGLIGVAYARVLVNVMVLLCSWLLLKRLISPLPVFPCKWDKVMFKEIVQYGISFQIISITAMLYDPITKALLSKFGGLSMVGYYEMASRMVCQFRALIVSAYQVLVPAIADLNEKNPQKILSVYLTSYQLLVYLALPLYSLIIVSTPIISELWIGYYENIFVLFATLLAIGWFFNSINIPAYFVNLGIGELRWNLISHIAIALLNSVLGILLGVLFEGSGVVVAWVVSLALGSSIIYISYHNIHSIPLIELVPKVNRMMIIVCLFSVLTAVMIQGKFNNSLNTITINSIVTFVFTLIIFIPFWRHPLRKWLIDLIKYEILN